MILLPSGKQTIFHVFGLNKLLIKGLCSHTNHTASNYLTLQ